MVGPKRGVVFVLVKTINHTLTGNIYVHISSSEIVFPAVYIGIFNKVCANTPLGSFPTSANGSFASQLDAS